LNRYGACFLEVIASHGRTSGEGEQGDNSTESYPDLSDTLRETYQLYREGLSLSEMIARRGLKDSTIAAHLEELVAGGLDMDLRRFVDRDKLSLIEARLAELGPVSLTALKEGLPEEITYTDLRLARGAWNHNS